MCGGRIERAMVSEAEAERRFSGFHKQFVNGGRKWFRVIDRMDSGSGDGVMTDGIESTKAGGGGASEAYIRVLAKHKYVRSRAITLQSYIRSIKDILKHASKLLKAELPLSLRLIDGSMENANHVNLDDDNQSDSEPMVVYCPNLEIKRAGVPLGYFELDTTFLADDLKDYDYSVNLAALKDGFISFQKSSKMKL
ncbi:unnamed protein product [Lactuca saligna]|uniref:Uncharacterized protein n=1 Tax=Lactuca saligna TaxID=75948 RepID=A0AA36DXP9_LACSI|nr:unnamed protein product [Lactuca saligna]